MKCLEMPALLTAFQFAVAIRCAAKVTRIRTIMRTVCTGSASQPHTADPNFQMSMETSAPNRRPLQLIVAFSPGAIMR